MGVYSHRFLSSEGAGQVLTYTVPVGQRAVVRSASAAAVGGASGEARLLVAGATVWVVQLTGPQPSGNLECRHVVYGGETIQTYIASQYTFLTVSGYLFLDMARATGAAGDVEERWLPQVAALPG